MIASTCTFTKNNHLRMVYHPYHFVGEVLLHPVHMGAKGDWYFRISDLVKNPDGTDI